MLDHAPCSQWMWCAAEETGVAAAWTAVAGRNVRRALAVSATQRFADFPELEARLASQPPASRERIASHRGHQDVSIDMPDRLALL